jgi:hypothetical protein
VRIVCELGRMGERDEPMALWQLDIVGGAFLADGTEAKIVTGVDDHSRYCVIASVVARATGRAVCLAFASALRGPRTAGPPPRPATEPVTAQRRVSNTGVIMVVG